MDLVSQLHGDMKTALKAGDKMRLGVIRMLLSDAQTADLRKQTPQEAVSAYARKLQKSIEEFRKYGKPAEVEQLGVELEIVKTYLPKKASAEETAVLVDQFLASNTYTEKQLGQAMGAFIKASGGSVDPGIANAILRQKLTGK